MLREVRKKKEKHFSSIHRVGAPNPRRVTHAAGYTEQRRVREFPHAEGATGKVVIHTSAFNWKSGATKAFACALFAAAWKKKPSSPSPTFFFGLSLLASNAAHWHQAQISPDKAPTAAGGRACGRVKSFSIPDFSPAHELMDT